MKAVRVGCLAGLLLVIAWPAMAVQLIDPNSQGASAPTVETISRQTVAPEGKVLYSATFHGDAPWDRYPFGRIGNEHAATKLSELSDQCFRFTGHYGPKTPQQWRPLGSQEAALYGFAGEDLTEAVNHSGVMTHQMRDRRGNLFPRPVQGHEVVTSEFPTEMAMVVHRRWVSGYVRPMEPLENVSEQPYCYETWDILVNGMKKTLFVDFYCPLGDDRCRNPIRYAVQVKLRRRFTRIFERDIVTTRTEYLPAPAPMPTPPPPVQEVPEARCCITFGSATVEVTGSPSEGQLPVQGPQVYWIPRPRLTINQQPPPSCLTCPPPPVNPPPVMPPPVAPPTTVVEQPPVPDETTQTPPNYGGWVPRPDHGD